MFETTEIFAEILLVGFMFLFAISPIAIRFLTPREPGLLPFKTNEATQRSWIAAALVLGLAYTLGIAGYRLVSDVFEIEVSEKGDPADAQVRQRHDPRHEKWWRPGAEFEDQYKASQPAGSQPADLKGVECFLRAQSAGAQEWVDRHKAYEKILRTASFSSILFLLAMLIHEVSSPKSERWKRYRAPHFVITVLLAALFLAATGSEEKKFKKDSITFYKVVARSPCGNLPAR